VFLAAAADCHFACTARRLAISQAAVSGHIAALERQFGRSLFDRKSGRKPVLSLFGQELLAEARALIGSAEQADRPEAPRPGMRPTVRVGAGVHLLDDHIKRHLPRFCKQYPDIDIAFEYADGPSECLHELIKGDVDLVVHTVPAPVFPPLHAEILGCVRLGLFAGGKLRAKRHAPPEELSDLPFVLPYEGSSACPMIRSVLGAAGIRCDNVVAHVQYANVAKALARQGEGLAALFTTMVGPDDAEQLVMLDIELATMYRTLFRADKDSDPAVETVTNFLREILVC
jgi:DNA-binding transcriptional LysR family regulator